MGFHCRLDLNAFAEQLGASVEEVILGAAEGVQEIVQRGTALAKERVPVAQQGGGRLRESLNGKVQQPQRYRIIGGWGTNVEYASYVEFGTGPVGRDTPAESKYTGPEIQYKADKWKGNIPDVGWRWISGMPAQPYMYPSFCVMKAEAAAILTRHIRRRMGGT